MRELRFHRGLDSRFVDRAFGWQAAVHHAVRRIPGVGAFAHVFPRRVELSALVPVHVVADGDGGVGCKGECAGEQATAQFQREERFGIDAVGGVAAGAGVGEEARGLRLGVGRGVGLERPRVCEGTAVFGHQAEGVRPIRLESADVEGEVAAFGIRRSGREAVVADGERRRRARRAERALDRDALVVDGGNEMDEVALVPAVVFAGGTPRGPRRGQPGERRRPARLKGPAPGPIRHVCLRPRCAYASRFAIIRTVRTRNAQHRQGEARGRPAGRRRHDRHAGPGHLLRDGAGRVRLPVDRDAAQPALLPGSRPHDLGRSRPAGGAVHPRSGRDRGRHSEGDRHRRTRHHRADGGRGGEDRGRGALHEVPAGRRSQLGRRPVRCVVRWQLPL